ncbi:MAG: HNH endonuclease [Nitrospinae bacterium]|nr:HNH endonuclease [Nitrospinota bacterium]
MSSGKLASAPFRRAFFVAAMFLSAAVATTVVAEAHDVSMPDPRLTPGATEPGVTKEEICAPGRSAKARKVTARQKREVYARYGLDPRKPPCPCEVDHFIPLELGGSNETSNLWPEPYGVEMGARKKDVVETRLHREVCGGVISLSRAQEIIRKNWPSCHAAIKSGDDCK